MSLLFYLILIPFIGGILSLFKYKKFNYNNSSYISIITIITTIIILLSHVIIIQPQFQNKNNYISYICNYTISLKKNIIFSYVYSLIPQYGISINLYLDGLSLIMIMLILFLGLIAIIASWEKKINNSNIFHCLFLWIIGSSIGVFLSIDLLIFIIFWEIIIILTYIIMIYWGNSLLNIYKRINIANKFLLYTQISGLILLISIISLTINYYNYYGILSFNYKDLIYTPLPELTEYIIMIGFFIAFAIKIPIIPFHGWFINIQSTLPTTGSLDLISMLSKIAPYSLLRFNLTLFPHTSYKFSSIAIFIGIITIFYGAWIAYFKKNIKEIISYGNISHMGLLLIALYNGNILSYYGAVIYIISHSISTAGLYIISGQLFKRLNTYNIKKMGGLWKKLNFIPGYSLFFSAATIGIPGTANFIGEINILIGNTINNFILIIIPTFIIIFSTIYILRMISIIYYGQNNSDISIYNTKTSKYEITTLLLLSLPIIIIGIFPNIIIKLISSNIEFLNSLYIFDGIHNNKNFLF